MNRICHNLWEKKNQNFRFHSASNPKRKKRKKKKKKIYHYWVKLKWGFFFFFFKLCSVISLLFFPRKPRTKAYCDSYCQVWPLIWMKIGVLTDCSWLLSFSFFFWDSQWWASIGMGLVSTRPWVRPESDGDIGSNEWRWFNHRRHSQLTKYQWIGREESGPMIALSFFN